MIPTEQQATEQPKKDMTKETLPHVPGPMERLHKTVQAQLAWDVMQAATAASTGRKQKAHFANVQRMVDLGFIQPIDVINLHQIGDLRVAARAGNEFCQRLVAAYDKSIADQNDRATEEQQ